MTNVPESPQVALRDLVYMLRKYAATPSELAFTTTRRIIRAEVRKAANDLVDAFERDEPLTDFDLKEIFSD